MFALRKVSYVTLSLLPERYTDVCQLTPSAAITATLQRFIKKLGKLYHSFLPFAIVFLIFFRFIDYF